MTTPSIGDLRTVKSPNSDWLTEIEMWTGERWAPVRSYERDDARVRRIFSAFLNRLYVYRNITLDHARVQLWLEKLDEYGRGCGQGWDTDEDWEDIMRKLEEPEVP